MRLPCATAATRFVAARLQAADVGFDGSPLKEDERTVLCDVPVLVVEDDFIVAFDLQTMLEDHGAVVIGPAASLEEAQAAFDAERGRLRIAVLDVNLRGECVFPLAAQMQAAGIPIVFATAYADDDRLFPERLRTAPRIAKPVLPNVLIAHVRRCVRRLINDR